MQQSLSRRLTRIFLVEWMERWNCDSHAATLLPGEITITLMDIAAVVILGLRVTGDSKSHLSPACACILD